MKCSRSHQVPLKPHHCRARLHRLKGYETLQGATANTAGGFGRNAAPICDSNFVLKRKHLIYIYVKPIVLCFHLFPLQPHHFVSTKHFVKLLMFVEFTAFSVQFQPSKFTKKNTKKCHYWLSNWSAKTTWMDWGNVWNYQKLQFNLSLEPLQGQATCICIQTNNKKQPMGPWSATWTWYLPCLKCAHRIKACCWR